MFYIEISILVTLIVQWTEAVNYTSQAEYVKEISEDIQNDAVKTILHVVDRKNYVEGQPYSTKNVQIGYGATFSNLEMQAFALDKLANHLKEGSRGLDIGSGTGYLTTCMALMVGQTGCVIGVEHIPELVNRATEYVMKDKPFLLEEGRIKFIEGDGRIGASAYGPYDAIHVGAKITDIDEIPKALMDQLKPDGRMIVLLNVPMSSGMNYQSLAIIDNFANGTVVKSVGNGLFVFEKCENLTDKHKQLGVTEHTTHHHF